ncbi:hypothetical protein CXB51_005751 [Gossypium anomalum]|uniref:Uncharacterized protein n=1 Tax=Gossypium anomalum TaxID=47600 RepID=A0A8J5ZMU6_9ROSI|nr:hypothetical protein CXB51_005751 [Gossypium anomalum]
MEPVLTTLGVIHVPMVAHCLMAALRSHGTLGGDDRAIESERSRCLECLKFPEPYCGLMSSGNPRVPKSAGPFRLGCCLGRIKMWASSVVGSRVC